MSSTVSFTVVPLHNLDLPAGTVIPFGKFTKLSAAADAILRTTAETNLRNHAEGVLQIANSMQEGADEWIATELQNWMTVTQATEHPIQDDHGARVAAAYFAGTPPFRTAKAGVRGSCENCPSVC